MVEEKEQNTTAGDSVLGSSKSSCNVLPSRLMSANLPSVGDLVENNTLHENVVNVPARGSSSPRLELIYKMRALEEESVNQCRSILRKMRLAMQRQRNVSNDIEDGVSELAEQLDVLERYRKSRKSAEEGRNVSSSATTAEVTPDTEPKTPVTRGKRIATSPAENISVMGKKMRGREPNTWQIVQTKRKTQLSAEVEQQVGKQKVKRKKLAPTGLSLKPCLLSPLRETVTQMY